MYLCTCAFLAPLWYSKSLFLGLNRFGIGSKTGDMRRKLRLTSLKLLDQVLRHLLPLLNLSQWPDQVSVFLDHKPCCIVRNNMPYTSYRQLLLFLYDQDRPIHSVQSVTRCIVALVFAHRTIMYNCWLFKYYCRCGEKDDRCANGFRSQVSQGWRVVIVHSLSF